MEIFTIILEVLKAASISLGVGGSTIVLALYLGALKNDGKIDKSEGRMLGIVYIALRVAMVLIFLSHLLLNIPMFLEGGVQGLMSPLNFVQWILLAILYVNAIIMTMHIMPDKYGPGIQVSTWMTLGIITTLASHVMIEMPLFVGAYIIFTIFAIWLIDLFKRDLKTIQNRKGMLR